MNLKRYTSVSTMACSFCLQPLAKFKAKEKRHLAMPLFYGGATGTRTLDPCLAKAVL